MLSFQTRKAPSGGAIGLIEETQPQTESDCLTEAYCERYAAIDCRAAFKLSGLARREAKDKDTSANRRRLDAIVAVPRVDQLGKPK